MPTIPELITAQDGAAWYVMGPWDEPCGPYRTKADAEETRRGLERTYRYHAEPGFITSERTQK